MEEGRVGSNILASNAVAHIRELECVGQFFDNACELSHFALESYVGDLRYASKIG